MRRIFVVLMMTCLILTGCSKNTNYMQQALDFRSQLLGADGCSFTADVTIEYPEKTFDFTMQCRFSGNDAELCVISPDAISGINATFHGDAASLVFDDVSLEFGTLANGYVAPLAAPWILGSAWSGDYISAAGKDGDFCRITWLKGYNDEELSIDTWFENETPVYAEISHDGTRVLQVKITEFVYL